MHINNKYRPTYQDPLRDIDCYTKLIAWKGCKAVHLLVLIINIMLTNDVVLFVLPKINQFKITIDKPSMGS